MARLGGDEFGILLEDVHDPEEATSTAHRALVALSAPLPVDGRMVSVRASIGLALDRPGKMTADELLRDADTAMYRAKSNGRGGVAVFEPSMLAHQLARLELDTELREAIEQRPVRAALPAHRRAGDRPSRRGRGAGALEPSDARHPGPGHSSTCREESGQIVAIGSWVVGEACRQARHWQLASAAAPDVRISVNTSARELIEPGFVGGIEAALAASGLAPTSLTLEITESMMLADETAAIAALRRLRNASACTSSSTTSGPATRRCRYLNQLPVDGLKIDRSFVQGLGIEREKTAIVRATIAFARGLGLVVTAEGIETEAQLRQLIALQCDRGQGYWLNGPLDPEALESLLRRPVPYLLPQRQHRAKRAS